MKLLAFSKIGVHDARPRLWLEGGRLARLGFSPGQTVFTSSSSDRLVISHSQGQSTHRYTISRKRAAGSLRPVLDITNRHLLAQLASFSEVKLLGSYGRIVVEPSVRAFHIKRASGITPPFSVLDLFAGGGTGTQNLPKEFSVIAGLEVNPDYADCWDRAHPDALLIQGDLRSITPEEIPNFDVLVAGIPCSDHSNHGRAVKSLPGMKAEVDGAVSDLFIHVAALVQSRLPAAIVLENVPSFSEAAAGLLLKANLRKIGYSVFETITDPVEGWSEPQSRRRWVCVATLRPGFILQSPGKAFCGTAGDFLDDEDPTRDKADAERIRRTILGLQRHNERHAELGNGFRFSTIDRDSKVIPTIVRSMHKCNVGPFIQTMFGLRMLRQSELERIQGARAHTNHYATAVQVLGQGVQARIFAEIFRQLGAFLQNAESAPCRPEYAYGELF